MGLQLANTPKIKGAPPPFPDYPKWHLDKFNEDLALPAVRIWYETNAGRARSVLESHAFSGRLMAVLEEFEKAGLLANVQSSSIVFKERPFASVVDKLFRLNCNWNRRFPDAPKSGWVTCSNLFGKIDDLNRTLIVCRFLDQPTLICQTIAEAATASGLKATIELKATDEGYYAHHIILRYPFELLKRDGTLETIEASCCGGWRAKC